MQPMSYTAVIVVWQLLPLVKKGTGEGDVWEFTYTAPLPSNGFMTCHVLLRCMSMSSLALFAGQHHMVGMVLDLSGLLPNQEAKGSQVTLALHGGQQSRPLDEFRPMIEVYSPNKNQDTATVLQSALDWSVNRAYSKSLQAQQIPTEEAIT
jgi:hypothetical protein